MRLDTITRASDVSPLITTYDVKGFSEAGRLIGGVATPEQVAASSDRDLKKAVAHASETLRFLQQRFNWDGIDGKGERLNVFVHMPDITSRANFGNSMENAFWLDGRATGDKMPSGIYIGDGGRALKPLGRGLDVIAHEIGHAIISRTSNLAPAEQQDNGMQVGQPGALNESFGDVLASLVDNRDWDIGEDVVRKRFVDATGTDALRALNSPSKFTTMSPDVLAADVHDAADIPNLAAYRVAQQLGRKQMGDIWFDAFTKRLSSTATFEDAARATVEAAASMGGTKRAQAVTDAWKSVGVLD